MRINENVALAKAILNKQGITTDSPEYQDYLKIREICGTGHGYVGVLTRIRFQDGITDMDEISSIYDILKNSKIDIGKLNKLTYDDILNIFYDEFKTSESGEDYEVVFKDNEYTYYRVHTYKGILKTGSPSWCLKTKSNWDQYQSKYPIQFVVVNNKYKNKLIVPEDDIVGSYSSKKSFVRFGISVSEKAGSYKWIANNDNNKSCQLTTDQWTFFGVMCTIFNLLNGINKSYYEHFIGCEKVEGSKTWHRIIDRKKAFARLGVPENYFSEKKELYLVLPEDYAHFPVILVFDDVSPKVYYLTSEKKKLKFSTLSNRASEILEEYAKRSKSEVYYGVNLKLGNITMDDIQKDKKFIKMVDNWMIFDRNDDFYIAVNSKPDRYNIPTCTISHSQEQCDFEDDEPMLFYLSKKGLKPWSPNRILPIRKYHQKVIDEITGKTNKMHTRVKKFWDFLKNK